MPSGFGVDLDELEGHVHNVIVIFTGFEHVLVIGIEIPLHFQGFALLKTLEQVQQAFTAAGIEVFQAAPERST